MTDPKDKDAFDFLEAPDRRKDREPIIKVWDAFVRIGHWLMVIFFAIIYLRYRKFPLHAYAGYLMLLLVSARIVWGLVGTRAARFASFWFAPGEVMDYTRRMAHGHAAYYTSHNPLGALMVYALLGMMLVNGVLGLMLYSSGQYLGPLGELVPNAWEEGLEAAHKVLGHMTAALVALHIAGVVWSARAHRENYVLAMFTGFKRVPRHAERQATEGYAHYAEEIVRPSVLSVERWFNYRHPVFGSLLLVIAVVLIVLEVTEAAVSINKFLVAY